MLNFVSYEIDTAPFKFKKKKKIPFCRCFILWYHSCDTESSSLERFPWHNFHAVRTISRGKSFSGFSISRIGSKNTKGQFNLDIQSQTLRINDEYLPTGNFLPILRAKNWHQKSSTQRKRSKRKRRGRSIETSFSRFSLSLSPTSLERSRDWIHRASREVRSLNTRNICFLSKRDEPP